MLLVPETLPPRSSLVSNNHPHFCDKLFNVFLYSFIHWNFLCILLLGNFNVSTSSHCVSSDEFSQTLWLDIIWDVR